MSLSDLVGVSFGPFSVKEFVEISRQSPQDGTFGESLGLFDPEAARRKTEGDFTYKEVRRLIALTDGHAAYVLSVEPLNVVAMV
jgi:hypothetical protein